MLNGNNNNAMLTQHLLPEKGGRRERGEGIQERLIHSEDIFTFINGYEVINKASELRKKKMAVLVNVLLM